MNKITLLLAITLTTLTALPLKAQKEEKPRPQIANQIDSLINHAKLTIEINSILPLKGPSKTTIDGYQIQIEKDTLTTYLPYFGQATTISFGTSDIAIDIEQPITIDTRTTKRGNYVLRFNGKIKNTNESCDFTIEITEGGSCNISVQFPGRDSISYSGTIQEELK